MSYEDLVSTDGASSILVMDGVLETITGRTTHTGPVQIPVPDRRVDSLETSLMWPAEFTTTVDVVGDRARLRFDVGGEPVEWVAIGDGALVAGLSGDGELVALVAPDASVGRSDQFGMPRNPMEGMDQDEMMREMAAQMREQFDRERAAAARFVAEMPVVAYGVAQPHIPRRSMHVHDSTYGPGTLGGVDLRYGDEMGAWMPGGDHNAPTITVSHRRSEQAQGPSEPMHDEHLSWLAALEMREPEQNTETAPVMGGHDRFMQRLSELAAAATGCTMVVDGVACDATIVRTDHGFVVRSDLDGWAVTQRASNVAEPLEIEAVTDLEPYLEGLREDHERMLSIHEQSATVHATDDNAPSEAVECRRAAESLMHVLSPQLFGWDVAQLEAPTAFRPDIVERWGGPKPFSRRIALVTRATQLQTFVTAVARDGSVAHVIVTVHLPRPDGAGSGMSISFGDEWWSHEPDAVRETAGRRFPRDSMGQYELELNVLVERQPAGSYVIATDLLAELDTLLGGLATLLGR